jgi:hypothetical protein
LQRIPGEKFPQSAAACYCAVLPRVAIIIEVYPALVNQTERAAQPGAPRKFEKQEIFSKTLLTNQGGCDRITLVPQENTTEYGRLAQLV